MWKSYKNSKSAESWLCAIMPEKGRGQIIHINIILFNGKKMTAKTLNINMFRVHLNVDYY